MGLCAMSIDSPCRQVSIQPGSFFHLEAAPGCLLLLDSPQILASGGFTLLPFAGTTAVTLQGLTVIPWPKRFRSHH